MRDSQIIQVLKDLEQRIDLTRRKHEVEVMLNLKAMIQVMTNPPRFKFKNISLWRLPTTEKDLQKSYEKLRDEFISAQKLRMGIGEKENGNVH